MAEAGVTVVLDPCSGVITMPWSRCRVSCIRAQSQASTACSSASNVRCQCCHAASTACQSRCCQRSSIRDCTNMGTLSLQGRGRNKQECVVVLSGFCPSRRGLCEICKLWFRVVWQANWSPLLDAAARGDIAKLNALSTVAGFDVNQPFDV